MKNRNKLKTSLKHTIEMQVTHTELPLLALSPSTHSLPHATVPQTSWKNGQMKYLSSYQNLVHCIKQAEKDVRSNHFKCLISYLEAIIIALVVSHKAETNK